MTISEENFPNRTKNKSPLFCGVSCSRRCPARESCSKWCSKLQWVCVWGVLNVTYSEWAPVSDKIIEPNKEALVEVPWAKLHRKINHHELPFGSQNIFEFMNCPAINSKCTLQAPINWRYWKWWTCTLNVTVFACVWLRASQRILERREFILLNTLHGKERS